MAIRKFSNEVLQQYFPDINKIYNLEEYTETFSIIKEAKEYCKKISWPQHNIIKIEKRFEEVYVVAFIQDYSFEYTIGIACKTFTKDKRDVLYLRCPKARLLNCNTLKKYF